jgi:peptide/nickel transport system permease protein
VERAVKRLGLYLLRRFGAGCLTLVAMVTFTFLIYWALGQQPGRFVYPQGIKITAYQLHHGAHLLGADKPKVTQYGDWWWRLFHGDFGHQWTGAVLNDNKLTLNPIGPQLFPALRETLSLLIGGAALVLVFALPLGGIAGRRIGSLSDRTISLLALLGICTHPVVVGRLLDELFSNHLHWAPTSGYCTFVRHPPPTNVEVQPGVFTPVVTPCGGPVDWFTHMILPWTTFALLFLALYTRMVRASVADTIHEDYVRTARAKGGREVRVMARHVLPNAAMRVLTMVGMDIGTAIGVAVFVEGTYGFNGLGHMSVYAMVGDENISSLDLPLLLAVVTVITAIVVVGNFVVDFLYAVVDPRTATVGRPGRTKTIAAGVM